MVLKKDKQALTVVLALSGRAQDVEMEIPADDLIKETCMDTLHVKLDSLFLKEDKDEA